VNQQSATAVFDSPVGLLFARVDAGRLKQLSFLEDGRALTTTDEHDTPSWTTLQAVKTQLAEYFEGNRKSFDLPLLLEGSPFYRRVWEALCDIPYGKTISYGQLAQSLGLSDAARAVGAANGANPIAIIVPCHRVIGTDGRLVGYGGELARKRALLDLESGRVSLRL
jgi:methylated-DNA-[protein]-cysteine S-methyltransferase